MRKTTAMIISALLAALTAVGALIRIPTPVSSFTLQICFTAMAGCLLGSRWGAVSQLLYLLLGFLGLPVFTGGGGPAAFLHPTGGFLPGMVAMAWVTGKVIEGRGFGLWNVCLACCAGLGALYAIGLPWMHLVLTVHVQKNWTISQTLIGGMLVFLPVDLVKIGCTAWLCTRLRPHLPFFYSNGRDCGCQ